MAQEARELICMITRGTDHELSLVGFTIANGGITAGLKVFIFLSSSGVDLVRKRAADTTQVNPSTRNARRMIGHEPRLISRAAKKCAIGSLKGRFRKS